MVVGFLSLPTELTCHILLFLAPRDISRCTTTCKSIYNAARNSLSIQYKLELYAQGLAETVTLNSIDVSRKMHSLKKLASLWRSDFHVKTVAKLRLGTLEGRWKCGFWWYWPGYKFFIWDCNAGSKELTPCQEVPMHAGMRRSEGYTLDKVAVDPLQDLMVLLYSSRFNEATKRNIPSLQYNEFLVEFRSLSSQLPHPHSACTSLVHKHDVERYRDFLQFHCDPLICGDRVVVLYYNKQDYEKQRIFIQVIDWRKGYINSYPLHELGGVRNSFHLVDEQTMVVLSVTRYRRYLLFLYTLRELDGSPQHRITYLLPDIRYRPIDYYPSLTIHAMPSFHGTAARLDLLPDYVPSLESQIMVLEIQLPSPAGSFIVVIDMVIFSQQAILSETPVEIPWSDWGAKHAWCFPHHTSSKIGVFGSKMAYTLPLGYIPEPGEMLTRASGHEVYFYVHIWDFNQRIIARAENANSRSPSDPVICKSHDVRLPFAGEEILNRPYTATICRRRFRILYQSDKIFFDQDRLILTSWESRVVRVCRLFDRKVVAT